MSSPSFQSPPMLLAQLHRVPVRIRFRSMPRPPHADAAKPPQYQRIRNSPTPSPAGAPALATLALAAHAPLLLVHTLLTPRLVAHHVVSTSRVPAGPALATTLTAPKASSHRRPSHPCTHHTEIPNPNSRGPSGMQEEESGSVGLAALKLTARRLHFHHQTNTRHDGRTRTNVSPTTRPKTSTNHAFPG